jgi:hypothetical protein
MIAEMRRGEGRKSERWGGGAGPVEIPKNRYVPGGEKRIMILGEYRSTV